MVLWFLVIGATGLWVFMTLSAEGTPPTMLRYVKHNHLLHETLLLLTILTSDIPYVPRERRLRIEVLPMGFFRLVASYGYMESPDMKDIFEAANARGLRPSLEETTFYLGRESLLTTGKSPMMQWRKALFAFLSRNATIPSTFFGIPPDRVVELGAQIQI